MKRKIYQMVILNPIFIILLFLLIILAIAVKGYSTYGAPTEFGNLTKTTCYIGGDDGIVNCTGIGYFTSIFADVTGTANSSSYWDNLNVPSDLNYKILSYYENISNHRTHLSNFTDDLGFVEDNASWNENLANTLYADISITEDNGSWNETYADTLYADISVVDTTIGNCSVANSCSNIIYSGNTSWKVNNASYADNSALLNSQTGDYYLDDTTIGNCSTQYSCNSVIYSGNTSWINSNENDASHDECSEITNCVDDAYATEIELTNLLDNNYLELDGTGGSITGNIDSTADIELEGGGLCIDPAGCAVEPGNFEIENGSFCIDKDGSLACNAGAGNISVMDGCIKVMSAGSWIPTYIGADGTLGVEYDIEAGDNIYGDDFFNSGTNIDTLFVQANDWTTIDNYATGCTNQFVTAIGDTLTCASETDPKVGTLTNGKWCTTDGTDIDCTSDNPGMTLVLNGVEDTSGDDFNETALLASCPNGAIRYCCSANGNGNKDVCGTVSFTDLGGGGLDLFTSFTDGDAVGERIFLFYPAGANDEIEECGEGNNPAAGAKIWLWC